MRELFCVVVGLVAAGSVQAQGGGNDASRTQRHIQPVSVILAESTEHAQLAPLEVIRRRTGLPRNAIVIRAVPDTLAAFAAGLSLLRSLNREGPPSLGEERIAITSMRPLRISAERQERLKGLLGLLKASPPSILPGIGRGRFFSIDDRF